MDRLEFLKTLAAVVIAPKVIAHTETLPAVPVNEPPSFAERNLASNGHYEIGASAVGWSVLATAVFVPDHFARTAEKTQMRRGPMNELFR